ncbi:MAG: cytosine permease, partial [Rhodoglobus sp.]
EPIAPEVSEFDRLFQDPVENEPADEAPASQTWVIDADPVAAEPAAALPPLIEPPAAWNAEPAPVGLLPEPVNVGPEPIGIHTAAVETEFSAAEPEVATVEPQFSSAEPEFSSVEPEFSSVEPEFSSVEPEHPALEPEREPEPRSAEQEPLPELVVEPEPEMAVEPEPLPPVPQSPFAPPPLVEPPKYGLPPVADPFAPVDTADTVTTDVQAPAVDVPATASAFSFDELLTGEVSEEPARADETPSPETDPAQTIFLEPLPVLDADAVPVTTGSISVIDQAYEEELPDDVDETDRAFVAPGPVSVDTAGIAVVPAPLAAPSGPISTIRVAPEEVVLADNEPKSPGVFSLEESGLEPTPLDQRVGRAARLFWLWFAANSSVISLALGAVIFSLGISLRQAIVAALAGVAISFLPLGLGTLAGKRSGLPTMVVSRATFGLVGNILPALLALVTRLFWGAALLWILAISVTAVLTGGRISGGLSEFQLTIIALAVAFLLALLIAFVGYHLIARIQLILSILSGVLVVGLIVLTANRISISTALTTPDGPWILAVTGAVLVFSFVGLVWANSGADIARYQRFSSSGAGSMLWATFGATLPAFALIAYGALLAASDPKLATGLVTNPIGAIAGMLPLWYPIPLIAAVGLSLLSGVIITLYSGGFALQAIGIRAPRQWSIVIVGVLLLGVAFLLVLGVGGGIQELVRDVATTLAVPTAAWAGIFAAELMIRNRRFETDSLLKRGGVYPDVRWLNLPMLIIITVVGLGFTSATVGWLGWEGYLFTAVGVPLDGDLAASDLGVLVALVLGLLTPILGGIPAIRKQESMRV